MSLFPQALTFIKGLSNRGVAEATEILKEYHTNKENNHISAAHFLIDIYNEYTQQEQKATHV